MTALHPGSFISDEVLQWADEGQLKAYRFAPTTTYNLVWDKCELHAKGASFQVPDN